MQTHEPPHLRIVVSGRMYAGMMKRPPKFSDRDRWLAAEASAALCSEIRERGWSLPPPHFRAQVGIAGEGLWPVIQLSASLDGVTWTKTHGFGFTSRRPGDIEDASAFEQIFKAAGLI